MEQIKKLMSALDITEEEARQLIADDKAIDKGAELFPLTKEQEKASKQARQVAKSPGTTKKENTKTKPIDHEKVQIISKIADFLSENVENLEIFNPSQQINFKIGENEYYLKLTRRRKK